MDRVLVYPGALPQDSDQLNAGLFALIGQAFLNQALLGSSTVVAGLACTPTSPASLTVNVGVGSIYQMDQVDAASYGSLGTNTNTVLKQGILSTAQALAITPPATTGFSQVYLVEAALQDVDTGSQVLSYYNSANPAQPFSGPANSGSSNYTIRSCKCTIALKAGVAATTGTQVTPSADVGYVGLFAITVANGQTQITSTSIAQLTTAPFFPTLPQVPYDVQQQNYVYAGQDTGTANTYVITFAAGQPQPSSYKAGMRVVFKALNANTGASTINVNGLGAVAIRRATGVALSAADINSGQIVELTYDGTVFQMANYLGAGATSNTNTVVDIPYVADTGTQNAIVATYSPAITSLTDGLYLAVKLANTITGAATVNVNGLGAKAIVLGDGTNPPYNVFLAGMDLLLAYSTAMGKFQIANTSASMFYLRPTSNYTIYVNASTGSDTLYDGTSATVVGGSSSAGPFKTIGKAVSAAFAYAPSQFTITISVAAGTYNESVATPTYAGPNLIIDGGVAGNVLVNSGSNGVATFAVNGANTLTVKNITVQNASTTVPAFIAGAGGVLNTQNTVSNAVGTAFLAQGGTVNPGTHTFSGSTYALFYATQSGSVSLGNSTVFTFSTPISVALASAAASSGGSINVNTLTPPSFVNPTFVSGAKYNAALNGVINAGGLGVNFFPGTIAGTTATGGQASF